jgi:hypothetical protein
MALHATLPSMNSDRATRSRDVAKTRSVRLTSSYIHHCQECCLPEIGCLAPAQGLTFKEP